MTNETPDTLKRLLQILAKQGTANDDITGNSRNHWRKIAAKGLTRGRFAAHKPMSLSANSGHCDTHSTTSLDLFFFVHFRIVQYAAKNER